LKVEAAKLLSAMLKSKVGTVQVQPSSVLIIEWMQIITANATTTTRNRIL